MIWHILLTDIISFILHLPEACVYQLAAKSGCFFIFTSTSTSTLLTDVIWHIFLSDVIWNIYSFSNISSVEVGIHPCHYGTLSTPQGYVHAKCYQNLNFLHAGIILPRQKCSKKPTVMCHGVPTCYKHLQDMYCGCY